MLSIVIYGENRNNAAMKIEQSYLEKIYQEVLQNNQGKVADYIPELKKASPEHFAISLVTTSGQVISVGQADRSVTLQSLSKPFVYGLALEEHGETVVHAKIGVEPTGEAFDSIVELELESHRPFNPMINSGAIATTSLISGKNQAEKLERIHNFFAKFIGHPISVDKAVYLSEKATGDRNRAIAYLMKNFSIIEGEVEEILDLYFQQCSILMSTQEMAWLGVVLANGGVHPKTKERLLKSAHVKNILSLMMSCGMYDTSGKWVFEVGLPAKSGVSGVVLAVVPGVASLAVSSPLLDRHGHSIRGVEVVRRISEDLQLNIFMPKKEMYE